MEPVIITIYLIIALVIYVVGMVMLAKHHAYHDSSSIDDGDRMFFGIMGILGSLLWPITILGLMNLCVSRYYKRKAERERMITAELSRG